MCGIAGFVDSRHAIDQPSTLLQAMQACLVHRGPDGSGVLWHNHDSIGLAHTRLSVIDTSTAGHQPMVSASARYAMVLNGEVYNAPTLANELKESGVTFRGHSDTEVVLEAIDAWGLHKALQRFAGMFAMAIHDRTERCLYLIRDRLGIKPLHYAWIGGEAHGVFAFASELKAILKVPGFERQMDERALAGFFSHGCVTGCDCIWRGVSKVSPGHWVRVALTDGATSTYCYWDALEIAANGVQNPLRATDPEAEQQLDDLLRQVMGEHLQSDVPLAAFLSGGVDSAAVASLAAAATVAPLRAFTVGFDDPAFDERPAARSTAAALGLQWMECQATQSDLLACVSELSNIFDEPFADASQIPTLVVSRLMRTHATVALSGDGGDEVFGGYHRHVHAAGGWNTARSMPHSLRHLIAGGVHLLSRHGWDALLSSMRPLLPNSLRLNQAGDRVYKWAAMLQSGSEREAYGQVTAICHDVAWLHAGRLNGASWWNDNAAARLPDFLRRLQFMDQTGYLVDDVLVKVDRASMAASLEVRVPLLDHRVVEFAWSLPARMKVRGGRGKWLLRQVLRRHVPESVMAQPKRGFSVPLEKWLRGPLRSWAGDLVSSSAIRHDAMLDAMHVQRLWNDFCHGQRGATNALWCVVMYAAWKQSWNPSK